MCNFMKKYIMNLFTAFILTVSVSFTIALPIMAAEMHNSRQEIQQTLKRFGLENRLKEKSQMVSGPCWAFASIATLEASLAKKNLLSKPLSEKALLNWSNRRANESGWHVKLRAGGNLTVSDAYLASGGGPYTEDVCRYNLDDNNYNKINSQPTFSVRGIKIVDNNVNSIKADVSAYGAVAACYQSTNGGHAVSIVGWNDKSRCWLVKDSGSCCGSYKWLSFDTRFCDLRAYTNIKKYDSKEKVYQHDNFGVNGSISSNGAITCANVFDFAQGDVLNSVMVYSEAAGATCNIYLAEVNNKTGEPLLQNLKCIKRNAKIPHKGYSSIDVEKQSIKGKRAIVVEISGNNAPASIGLLQETNLLKMFEPSAPSYRWLNGKFVSINNDPLFSRCKAHSYSIKAIVRKN